jgi:hypothetical protein
MMPAKTGTGSIDVRSKRRPTISVLMVKGEECLAPCLSKLLSVLAASLKTSVKRTILTKERRRTQVLLSQMKFGRIQKIDYYLNTLLLFQKEKEMAAGKGAHLRVLDSTLHCFGQMMGALLSFFPCRPIADHAIAYLVY